MIERILTDDTGIKLKKAATVVFVVQIILWVIITVVLFVVINGLSLIVGAVGIFMAYLSYVTVRAIADMCYNSHAQVLYLQHIDLCIAKLAEQDPVFVRDVSMPDIPNVDTTSTQESS